MTPSQTLPLPSEPPTVAWSTPHSQGSAPHGPQGPGSTTGGCGRRRTRGRASTWPMAWPHLSPWSIELTINSSHSSQPASFPRAPLSHYCWVQAASLSCGVTQTFSTRHLLPLLSSTSPRPRKSVHNLFFLAVEQLKSEMPLQLTKWVPFPNAP